ncbi:diguanylate cyclase domain-containing protein [Meridianimarinicoccus aquatilis]|uniref:Diguanylate cyclase n=1 Tax=Meridianimarinicoccus aquatilis TaxID=2552766 RepID=A0A4R6AVX8_9RHOB|nr:diguanylate cyclase [Fluviibacterium aquatile]TDL87835.1 diguanylate cyclase [Fluviibacterium aquatile]
MDQRQSSECGVFRGATISTGGGKLTQQVDDLGPAARDALMPMHILAGPDGVIHHVGPTMTKVSSADDLTGANLFDVFTVRRPHGIRNISEFLRHSGVRLQIQFRDPPNTQFKGIIVPCRDGVLLNLAFGTSIVEAIRAHDLKGGDFAPTDLTVEMLYLLEAKATILEEWRRLNSRLQSARSAAEEQAFTDTLTGLRNRRAMDHVLDRLVSDGHPFGLIHLDLDYFKAVNDTLGHAAGDHVLQVAARAMVDVTRAEDTLVRAGGDEFVLILPGLVDAARLLDLSRRLIQRLQEPILFEGRTCQISGSAGITVSHGGGVLPVAHLLEQADRALYFSKNAGRGRATTYAEDLPVLSGVSSGH